MRQNPELGLEGIKELDRATFSIYGVSLSRAYGQHSCYNLHIPIYMIM